MPGRSRVAAAQISRKHGVWRRRLLIENVTKIDRKCLIRSLEARAIRFLSFLIDREGRQWCEADLAFGNEDPTSGHHIKCESQTDEAVMIT
jgi:hypothetical protein